MRINVLTALLLAALALPLHGQPADQPPLPCVTPDTPPVIDGVLDDECWQKAPKVTDFFNHETDTRASEKTEAFICADSRFIYAAFRCYDSQPEKIKAEQKSRGGAVGTDDWVQIYIDPYHDLSSPVWFRVTPRGVQLEQLQSSQGGKIEWIGDWKAAAKRLPDGYCVEMMIPFSVMRYGRNQHSMGICFRRQHARTGEGWTAPDITSNHELSRYYNFSGITPPEVSSRPLILGYSLAGSGEGVDERFRTGMDIKQTFDNGLTGVLTMNPDFRNVEQSVGSISFSYSEKYLPDSRPFFLEGAGYFPGSTMFYSRRIADTDIGAKLVGKSGNYSYAFLNTQRIGEESDFVGQISRQYREDAGYWLAMTHTDQPDLVNSAYRVSCWKRLYNSVGQQTKATFGFDNSVGGTGRDGSRLYLGLDNSVAPGRLGWYVHYYDVAPYFYPALGIEDETDKRGLSGWFGIERKPDKKIRSSEAGIYWDLLDRQDGSVFKDGIGGYVGADFQNGTFGTIRYLVANREPFHDRTFNVGFGWNSLELYRGGEIQCTVGEMAGGHRTYYSLTQGFKITDSLAFQAWLEQEKIDQPSPYAGTRRQVVGSVTYDLDVTQGITARAVRLNGRTNLSTAFRRRVSSGLDAYVIYGDPNAEETVRSIYVKLVRPIR